MHQAHRVGPVISHALLPAVLTTAVLLPCTLNARDTNAQRIPITLGDYRFSPHQLTLEVGQAVLLELSNTDSVTPHNFTLEDKAGNLDIDIELSAGTTREVAFTPEVTGTYTFYCSKKLMEGTLVVTPDNP